jgi:hypothetical protein
MNDALNHALNVLKAVPWCENLGRAEDAPGCLVLRNSGQARESFASAEWAGFTLMIRNRNYRDVARGDHARSKEWDKIAQSAWPDVSAIAEKMRKEIALQLSPPTEALEGIATDVWAILFELVYADLCRTPVWQSRILPPFKRGNLPCGWSGPEIDERWAGASDDPLPDGKVLVF